jgi:hypothetical protein
MPNPMPTQHPYRIDDRGYDTLSAAKGQLTRLARQYRSFRRLHDTLKDCWYRYDVELGRVVQEPKRIGGAT